MFPFDDVIMSEEQTVDNWQLAMLPQSEHCEFNPRMVHGNYIPRKISYVITFLYNVRLWLNNINRRDSMNTVYPDY